jgi:hypothetical protein
MIVHVSTTTTTTATAIGLSPGGSSPTPVQTKIKIHKTTKQLQNIRNTKQQNNYKTINISTQTEHRKCKYIPKKMSLFFRR